MTAASQIVHVRINDAATGKPTPVRIRFTTPADAYLAPLGRAAEFATGVGEDVGGNLLLDGKHYAYIDGTCEISLPAGPVIVQIHKGPEYIPLHKEIVRGAGQSAIRLSIARWIDLHQEGWYAGDNRAHYLSPHAALLEGAAEDLAVVNLLALEETHIAGMRSYHAAPNLLAFSGQRPALEVPGHMVVVNTLNSHPNLGGLALLNCHRVVYPLRIGGSFSELWENWTLSDWCSQCHRKNGLVVWCDSDITSDQALMELIPGQVDALETTCLPRLLPPDSRPAWYLLLNRGFRVPLVGGSGKRSNGERLGATRTYAQLQPGERFTYKSWIEAIRSGRTMVTAGPLLSFKVDGHDPGAVIDLPEGCHAVRLWAEARSQKAVERLEVLFNGNVVAAVPSAHLEKEVSVATSGWLAARCWGPGGSEPAEVVMTAHTSPIYVEQSGERRS